MTLDMDWLVGSAAVLSNVEWTVADTDVPCLLGAACMLNVGGEISGHSNCVTDVVKMHIVCVLFY